MRLSTQVPRNEGSPGIALRLPPRLFIIKSWWQSPLQPVGNWQLALSFAFSMAFSIAFSIACSIAFSIAFSIAYEGSLGIALSIAFSVAFTTPFSTPRNVGSLGIALLYLCFSFALALL